MRDLFLLDPDVVFLNHGSFGACPKPVFEAYQAWQLRLERQPVEFLGRQFNALMAEARMAAGHYLHASADDIMFLPNATFGINLVARSLELAPGDEILTTDHEYGAVDYTWDYTGAKIVRQAFPLPLTSDFVEEFWQGVTPHTKVIAISHITSPTALMFPVEEICRRAREAGIITVIDGAHVPGQLPLDLTALDADFYTGNFHKWLCAPKGCAFLYARRELQHLLKPLVVSWGWQDESFGNTPFIRHHQWQGTRDVASFLSLPAAIQFQQEHDWDAIRQACHELAVETRRRINGLTGEMPICTDDQFMQMFTVAIPTDDVFALKAQLYDTYKIELPAIQWQGKPYMRVSIQGYNTGADADALLAGLSALL